MSYMKFDKDGWAALRSLLQTYADDATEWTCEITNPDQCFFGRERIVQATITFFLPADKKAGAK